MYLARTLGRRCRCRPRSLLGTSAPTMGIVSSAIAQELTGFDIQVLGCSSKMPTSRSSCPCIGVRVGAKQMLFDCGEGTQRQFIHSFLNPSKVQGIFITHMHGDHVFGLPGMLLSFLSMLNSSHISTPASRQGGGGAPTEESLKSRTLRVYGPEGLYNYVCMTLRLCEAKVGPNADGRPAILVHELVGGDTVERRPAFIKRDRDFAMAGVEGRTLKPDRDGFWTIPSFDVDPEEAEGAPTRTEWRGDDTTKGGKHKPSHNPGRPQGFVVRAGQLRHTVPTFGYTVQEDERPGRLDAARIKAMGLRPGPLYKALVRGEDVTLPDGQGVIRAADVTGPTKRGRKLTVLGDTSYAYTMAALAQDSDVLIHEATLEDELRDVAVMRGHSTPSMAARFAKDVGARRLVLTHFSNRYTTSGAEQGGDKRPREAVAKLLRQAVAVLKDEERVLAAEDFLSLHVPLDGFALPGESRPLQVVEEEDMVESREVARERVAS